MNESWQDFNQDVGNPIEVDVQKDCKDTETALKSDVGNRVFQALIKNRDITLQEFLSKDVSEYTQEEMEFIMTFIMGEENEFTDDGIPDYFERYRRLQKRFLLKGGTDEDLLKIREEIASPEAIMKYIGFEKLLKIAKRLENIESEIGDVKTFLNFFTGKQIHNYYILRGTNSVYGTFHFSNNIKYFTILNGEVFYGMKNKISGMVIGKNTIESTIDSNGKITGTYEEGGERYSFVFQHGVLGGKKLEKPIFNQDCTWEIQGRIIVGITKSPSVITWVKKDGRSYDSMNLPNEITEDVTEIEELIREENAGLPFLIKFKTSNGKYKYIRYDKGTNQFIECSKLRYGFMRTKISLKNWDRDIRGI